MSDLSIIHFLKITGLIDRGKKQEFEHTVKFACSQFSSPCIECSLSAETDFHDTYYFFVSWVSETALRKFVGSNEYQLIRSAYDALGLLKKIEIAYHAEIKTILIHHL